MQALLAFLPYHTARAVLENPQTSPLELTQQMDAIAVFADISGFTPISEALAQLGSEGAEELTNLLNTYFGDFINIIEKYGGSVAKFGGDALNAIFPVFEADKYQTTLRRALHCASDIQDRVLTAPTLKTRAGEFTLSVRIGVAAGKVLFSNVGDPAYKLEYIVAGSVLDLCADAEQHAERGTIVAQDKLLEQAADIERQPLADGFSQILKVPSDVKPVSADILPEASPELKPVLEAYTHPTIAYRLEHGQTSFINELRRVTISFVRFTDFDYDNDKTAIERLQVYLGKVIEIVRQYDGYLCQVDMGDKGSKFIVMFGTPVAHEDEADRALRCSLALRETARQLGIITNTGINSGQVYCGLVGNLHRMGYTAVGLAMNISARLMQAAADDEIVVSASTRQMVNRQTLQWAEKAPIKVKGVNEPLQIFGLAGQGESRGRLATRQQLVGRQQELQTLGEKLAALKATKRGNMIAIEGEAGIGKTLLIEKFTEAIKESQIPVYIGTGEITEQNSPYYAWRLILNQLFDIGAISDLAVRQARVLEQLQYNPQVLERAPLLNLALGIDLPDNELTQQITGQLRAINTQELIVQILGYKLTESGCGVIVLEDGQWVDRTSWQTTQLALQQLPQLMLIVGTRPVPETVQNEYTTLRNQPETFLLHLENLVPDEIVKLVATKLGVETLPEEVTKLIIEKAEGHPFFSGELAYSLRESGLIQIENGVCKIAPFAGDLSKLAIPDTIEGVITSRIDRLEAGQQLVLKVASIIGRVFAFNALRTIYPTNDEEATLFNHLKTLERLEITPLEMPEPDLSYIFKHAITQEVAYNLMLHAQRRELHAMVAAWYEQTYAQTLNAHYPVLAYHWKNANDPDKTLFYLDKAAEQATQNGAFQSSLYFVTEIFKLVEEHKLSVTAIQKGVWFGWLGRAYIGLLQPVEAIKHLHKALGYFGINPPEDKKAVGRALMRELVQQIKFRFSRRQLDELSPEERERVLRIFEINLFLAELYTLVNDQNSLLHSMVMGANLVEPLEASNYKSGAYIAMGFMAASIPFRPVANYYLKLYHKTKDMTQDKSFASRNYMGVYIYHSTVCLHETSIGFCNESIEINRRLNDRRQLVMMLSFKAMSLFHLGRFQEASDVLQQSLAEAVHSDNKQMQFWVRNSQATCLMKLGRYAEAEPLLYPDLLEKFAGASNFELLRPQVNLVLWNLRQGTPEQAEKSNDELFNLLNKEVGRMLGYLLPYAQCVQTYLELWERALHGELGQFRQAELQAKAAKALKLLTKYSKIVPQAEIYVLLYKGIYLTLTGETSEKANQLWYKGLEKASELGIEYDQGLLHYQLGRYFPVGLSNRRYHLLEAARIFKKYDSDYELKQVEALL